MTPWVDRAAGESRPARAVARPPDRADHPMLRLQQAVGNQAAARLVQRQVAQAPPGASLSRSWTDGDIRAIQAQLQRLGLYRGVLDGVLGPGTDSALVEAYGDRVWEQQRAPEVLERVRRAQPTPGGRSGEHRFRFGELLRDGLLELTVAIGFQEEDDASRFHATEAFFAHEVTAMPFMEDTGAAAAALARHGRRVPSAPGERRFVLRPPMSWQPPAGAPRTVDVVLRLLYSRESTGPATREAFTRAMAESDVAYYGGHGRYGTGPDFDRLAMFRMRTTDGEIITANMHRIERIIVDDARSRAQTPWATFEQLLRDGHLQIDATNLGNLRMNRRDSYPTELGSRIMNWILDHGPRGPTPVASGRDGQMASASRNPAARPYRVVVFDGCRTQDYVPDVRSTPGFAPRAVDLIVSRRPVTTPDNPPGLRAFLEAILARHTAEQTIRDFNASQHPDPLFPGEAYRAQGVADNPVVP